LKSGPDSKVFRAGISSFHHQEHGKSKQSQTFVANATCDKTLNLLSEDRKFVVNVPGCWVRWTIFLRSIGYCLFDNEVFSQFDLREQIEHSSWSDVSMLVFCAIDTLPLPVVSILFPTIFLSAFESNIINYADLIFRFNFVSCVSIRWTRATDFQKRRLVFELWVGANLEFVWCLVSNSRILVDCRKRLGNC
jgi:hypothetical protein